MQNATNLNTVKPLSKIELTALFIFSAVMFYLIAQVFLLAHKNKTYEQASIIPTPTSDVSESESIAVADPNARTSDATTPEALTPDTLTPDAISSDTPVQIDDAIATPSLIAEPSPEKKNSEDPVQVEFLQAINVLCKKIADKLGSVSLEECNNAQLQHSGSLSTNEQALAYRDFAHDNNDRNSKETTRIMLIGGIHGDEFSGVSVSFKWLNNLAKVYSKYEGSTAIQNTDGDLNQTIKNLHWRVIPLLNPDGLLQPDGQSHRMNANKVDLNRNFPTPDWDELAIKYWKEKRYSDKRRYPGPSSGSETETQWIVDQINEFKPHAVISIHAPYGIVDADGPSEPPPNLGPLQLKILGTYPGSMGRYVGVYKNSPMLTVELKHAGIMPSKKDIDHIWSDILEWIDDKVVGRNTSDEDPALQSMRHEINGVTKEIVIDKTAGD